MTMLDRLTADPTTTDHLSGTGTHRTIDCPPTTTTIKTLVSLLMRADRARTIRPDNTAGAWLDVDQALDRRHAWYATTAPDVLAWDLDDPRALAGLTELISALDERHVPRLLVPSGRPGHQHLWAVVPDARQRDQWQSLASIHGLPPARRTIRPPLTPHRLNGPASCTLSSQALEAFSAAISTARRTPAPTRAPLRWNQLLRTGQWPAGHIGDQTGSALTWQICIGAIRDGITLPQLAALLSDPDNAGGDAYRRKGHAWLARHVWEPAALAATRPRVDSPDGAHHELDLLTAATELAAWPGKSGGTDLMVLRALVAQGRRFATITPSMSHRQVAEAAPCSRNTVGAAVRRLSAAGWLQAADVGRGRTKPGEGITEHQEELRGTRWRLLLNHHRRAAAIEHLARIRAMGGTPRARTGLSVTGPRALDVLRWGGAGLQGARVLEQLEQSPLTGPQLALRLGLNCGNLRARLLPRLAALGLIERSRGLWQVPAGLDAALEQAAEALGLAGKTASTVLAHARERQAYVEHRDYTRPVRLAAQARRIKAWYVNNRSAGAEQLPHACEWTGRRLGLGIGSPAPSSSTEPWCN